MLEIEKKQNEDEILRMLYSARKNYNLAEKYFIFLSVFTVIPIILNRLPDSSVVRMIGIFISYILVIIFGLIFQKKIRMGAYTKEYIDRILYGLDMILDKTEVKMIKAEASKLSLKYEEEYLKQISNNGENKIRGVRDWYYINKERRSDLENIYQCQCQNIYWDKELNKVLKYILGIISFSLLIVLLVISRDKTILNFLSELYAFVPVLSAIVYFFIENNKYKINATSLETFVNMFNEIKNEEARKTCIENIQKAIFERRKSTMIIPDILHKINSNTLHKILKKNN